MRRAGPRAGPGRDEGPGPAGRERFYRRFLLSIGAIEARFVELYGLGWHDGGDGVLVDQLGLAITAQEHAEVVEPADDALQFDAVDQEDGQRGLRAAHAVEEGVLQVLLFFDGCRGGGVHRVLPPVLLSWTTAL